MDKSVRGYWLMKWMQLTYTLDGRNESCELSVADMPLVPLKFSYSTHGRRSFSGAIVGEEGNTSVTVHFYRFQVDISPTLCNKSFVSLSMAYPGFRFGGGGMN